MGTNARLLSPIAVIYTLIMTLETSPTSHRLLSWYFITLPFGC